MALNRDRAHTVAFTGYRPEKIRLSSANPAIEAEIRGGLRAVLEELYALGYRTFLSGMAEGFDIWAAQEVLGLRESGRCPDMELVAVVPFEGQPAGFTPAFRQAHESILGRAREAVVLAPRYYQGCYEARNDYLVENSSVVVCYFDGQPGGTMYTVKKARRHGLRVINLLESLTLF